MRLSVAIVTRKRPKKLARCLDSIIRQRELPDTILVVDNDENGSARPIVARYRHRLPVEYLLEKTRGIPRARNKAIDSFRTELLGYVDDDCVLDSHWVYEAKRAIQAPSASYVVGKTLLYNKHSIPARAHYFIYSYWFHRKIDIVTNRHRPKNLDTKNVVFKSAVFKTYELRFDSRFNINPIGGGEDVDLSLALDQIELHGYYAPKMIVSHEEVDTFKKFFQKAYFRGRSSFLVHEKWKDSGYVILDPSKRNLLRWLMGLRKLPQDYREIGDGSAINKLQVLFLVKLYDRVHLRGFLDQSALTSSI